MQNQYNKIKTKDPLNKIFLETEKEKMYYIELQQEKRKHRITEENRIKLLNENIELKEQLKKLQRIDKMENKLNYLERIILKLYRLTGNDLNEKGLLERTQ